MRIKKERCEYVYTMELSEKEFLALHKILGNLSVSDGIERGAKREEATLVEDIWDYMDDILGKDDY